MPQDETLKSCNTKFATQYTDPKTSYKRRHNVVLFCILVSIVFGWNFLAKKVVMFEVA